MPSFNNNFPCGQGGQWWTAEPCSPLCLSAMAAAPQPQCLGCGSTASVPWLRPYSLSALAAASTNSLSALNHHDYRLRLTCLLMHGPVHGCPNLPLWAKWSQLTLPIQSHSTVKSAIGMGVHLYNLPRCSLTWVYRKEALAKVLALAFQRKDKQKALFMAEIFDPIAYLYWYGLLAKRCCCLDVLHGRWHLLFYQQNSITEENSWNGRPIVNGTTIYACWGMWISTCQQVKCSLRNKTMDQNDCWMCRNKLLVCQTQFVLDWLLT